MEKSIMKKLNDVEKGLTRFDKIGILLETTLQQEKNTEIDKRLASVELHMKGIADTLGVKIKDQSINEIPDQDLEREDRKRLKQRLKDAIEYKHEISTDHSTANKTGWTEHIFGICSPDGRVGKEGSRSLLSLIAFLLTFESERMPTCF
jgi:hypothetical protein